VSTKAFTHHTTITQLRATHNGRDQDSGPLAWQTMMRGSVLTQHDHTSRRDSALLLHSLGTSPKPQQRQQHPAGQGVPLNTQPFANRTQGYCILIPTHCMRHSWTGTSFYTCTNRRTHTTVQVMPHITRLDEHKQGSKAVGMDTHNQTWHDECHVRRVSVPA